MKQGLALVAIAGCGGAPSVGSLAVLHTAAAPPAATSCEPTPALPPLDPAFAPKLDGAVALVAATGDARLSAMTGILTAWSSDSAIVGFADSDTVTLWRSSDATLVDRISCPGGEMGENAFVMSPDLRWIAVSGARRLISSDSPVTCIIDRSTHAARLLPGEIDQPRFEGDLLVGRDRSIELATGKTQQHPAPAPPAPAPTSSYPPLDTGDAVEFAVSHDGRYLAGWTVMREIPAVLLGAGVSTNPSGPPAFLAVWDRATGKQLWRDDKRCCSRWQFSPDDRFLEAGPGRANKELLRVQTGEVLAFPGQLLPIAPDGNQVIVEGGGGAALWTIDPQRPKIAIARPRTVAARSRDGAIIVASDAQGLVIERAGACLALGVKPSFRDPIELSPDGSLLYAGLEGQATISTSTFDVWRTDTGALVNTISVDGVARIYPMPGVGRVGFGARDGIRIYDALTARSLAVAEAPRVSQGPDNAQGESWGVRDDDGERADVFDGPVTASHDGRYLVGHASLGKFPVSIWDLHDRHLVRDLPEVPPVSFMDPVALSPDERFVAAGMRNGVVALWTRDAHAIPVAAHHDGWVELLAFSADGRVLATSGKDGLVFLVDTATGATLGSATLAADRATYLWWSADQLVIDTARRFRITVRLQAASSSP